MSEAGNMLVLADPPVGEEVANALDGEAVTHLADPYDALIEMGRQRWPVVLLTAGRGDFAGLCRATRRLQGDSRLFALCSPAAEAEVRDLLDRPLDDYFIYPLRRQDVAALRRATMPVPSGPAAAFPPAAAALAGRQLAELIEAASTVAALEAHLARTVGSMLGVGADWVDADQVPPGRRPLLLTAGQTPQVLLPRQDAGEPDAAAEGYLAAVRECLPALVAAARRTEGLHRLAITDHLTGAYNRRYFYHVTDLVLQRAERDATRATLLLYDIDDFKRYNDAYGHAAGDEILRDTAALMKQITRAQDIVARIGGDEFAVLFRDDGKPRMPGSRPPEDAFALADRFRRAVQTHKFHSLGPEASGILTISGGLASFPQDGRCCRDLLRAADGALRRAKESGKNEIHLIGPD